MMNRPRRPAVRGVIRFAFALSAVAALPLVLTARAAAVEVRTLVAFDRTAGQTPESVAIAEDGTVYVSLAFASEIYRITPTGQRSTLDIPTAGGITVGLAIDPHQTGSLYVAVRSANPAAAGVWRVARNRFDHPTRVVPLPTDSFPNGMTFDRYGSLYIADSNLGRIWRVAAGAAQATVWAAGPLLAPTGESFEGFALPGANGIKVRARTLYVSNTATRTIITIPIDSGGSAGPMTVRFHGVEVDDFAFAANGDLYATENPSSQLLRITPGGIITTLADSTDGLDNPSDVAVDPLPDRRRELLITNSAYFGTRPSLEEIRADSVGQRLTWPALV
jgi:sugar lactone lactonase YvrE